jgi:hypothetical protein
MFPLHTAVHPNDALFSQGAQKVKLMPGVLPGVDFVFKCKRAKNK